MSPISFRILKNIDEKIWHGHFLGLTVVLNL